MKHSIAGMWLVLLALFAANSTAHGEENRPLIFGVFPRWNAQVTVRDFTPLGEWLSRELDRPVRIETDKDFDSFMRRVYAREFDIVHLNQSQYISARNKAGYRVIVRTCDNPDCTIKAIIVARRDSGLANVSDLKGKTVAFGDPGAMVSYILARSILSDFHLVAGQYKTIFTRNPPNALLAVYNGDADAAGVAPAVFQQPEIRQRIDIRQLVILAESRPIPHLPVAVRGDMNNGLALRIQYILTQLARQPKGRRILTSLGIERFDSADDAQYQTVEDLMNGKDR